MKRLRPAIQELCRAVDFYDKVEASTFSEKFAVGSDHLDWVLKAAKSVRKAMARNDRWKEKRVNKQKRKAT